MKKLYIPMAAMFAAIPAFALDSPYILEGMMVAGITPDGKYALMDDQYNHQLTLVNVETGDVYWECFDVLSSGTRHVVSNTLVVPASSETDQPYYVTDGEAFPLPIPEDSYGAFPHAISTDGSVIVGSVASTAISLDYSGVMSVPCLWRVNAEGGYDLCETLPYPTKDWAGATPQYVQAVDVNSDATVIVGQITSNNGFVQEPIVWRLGDEGYTYERVHPELINPDNVTIPEDPGDSPVKPSAEDYMNADEWEAYQTDLTEYYNRVAPTKQDFMSDEEREAYETALAAYFEDWENNPYPYIDDYLTEEEMAAYREAITEFYSVNAPDVSDYMTEEESAAYNAVLEEYEAAYATWSEAYSEYSAAIWDVIDVAAQFDMNSVLVSPSGKYMGVVATQFDEDTWETKIATYIFSLDSDEYWINDKGEGYYITALSDDGASLGTGNLNDYNARQLVYCPAPGQDAVLLADYLKENDPTTYAWIEENMTHPLQSWNPETYELTYEDTILTGTGCTDDSFQIIGSFVLNSWSEEETDPFVYTYIIPTGALSGIRGIAADSRLDSDIAVSMDASGVLTIKGSVSDVTVYDLNGRVVFSAENPANGLNTGLDRGAYIVKANGQGKTAVAKAIL